MLYGNTPLIGTFVRPRKVFDCILVFDDELLTVDSIGGKEIGLVVSHDIPALIVRRRKSGDRREGDWTYVKLLTPRGKTGYAMIDYMIEG